MAFCFSLGFNSLFDFAQVFSSYMGYIENVGLFKKQNSKPGEVDSLSDVYVKMNIDMLDRYIYCCDFLNRRFCSRTDMVALMPKMKAKFTCRLFK